MKNAFEQNLKDSLENFEVPYNGSAWEAMQARLDANAPSPSFEDKMKEGLNANQYPYNAAAWTSLSKRLDKGSKGGLKKWHVAAGIFGVAALTTFFILNSNSDTEKQTERDTDTKVAVQNQQQVADNDSNINPSQGDNNDQNGVAPISSDIVNNGDDQNTSSLDNPSVQELNQPNNPENQNINPSGVSNVNNSSQNNSGLNNNNSHTATPNAVGDWKYIAPAIPERMCQGEAIEIKNENAFPIVILYPNGLNWLGGSEKVTRLNPSLSGTYKIGYLRDQKFVQQSTFVVNEAPVAEFDFVDLSEKYLNGLPTIEVRATVKAASYKWNYENGILRGDDVDLHFYNEGMHPVTLTVTDDNGCSSSVEKTVHVDEDYNLMAMEAFVPNGINTTFMPYALTERNVNFKMIVLDPNDGHILYETSDALEGWDGTDQQTGSPAEMDKSYIWKVTLMNPEPGESAVYSGTVLMLSRQ